MSLNFTRKFVFTCYLFRTPSFKYLAKKKGLKTVINLKLKYCHIFGVLLI